MNEMQISKTFNDLSIKKAFTCEFFSLFSKPTLNHTEVTAQQPKVTHFNSNISTQFDKNTTLKT